jgi:hypothetical protein
MTGGVHNYYSTRRALMSIPTIWDRALGQYVKTEKIGRHGNDSGVGDEEKRAKRSDGHTGSTGGINPAEFAVIRGFSGRRRSDEPIEMVKRGAGQYVN